MKKIGVIVIVLVSFVSCQSTPSKKVHKKEKQVKKATIMEEYHDMKAKLEPQGYVITTDSVSKVFIDNSVTINFDKKNKKK